MYRVFSNKVIVYLFVLLIVDLSIAPALRIRLIQPVFLYLLIIYAGFHWGWGKTLHVATLSGLLRDMTSSYSLGIELVILSGLALILEAALHKIDRQSGLARGAATFFFVYAACLGTLLFSALFREGVSINAESIMFAFFTAVYTTCLMPLFFWITSGVFHDRSSLRQYELFR